MSRILVTAALLILSVNGLHAQDRALTVGTDANARVTIDNPSGSITVRACERNEVILGGGRSMARNVEIDATPKHVQLKVVHGHSLDVCVPRNAQLRAHSGSGSIRVEGVSGTVDVESGSGSVQVEGRPRTIHAMAFSGDVTILGGGSEVTRAESISGSVVITRAGGTVEAKSGSGNVNVKGEVREAELFAVSGNAVFDGILANGGRLSAESSSGSVDITLPRNTSAEYELSTLSGDIDNDFGPPATRTRGGPGLTLRFTVGDGGARIKGHTLSGSVRVQDR